MALNDVFIDQCRDARRQFSLVALLAEYRVQCLSRVVNPLPWRQAAEMFFFEKP
jgi:hypothetical protein